MPDTSAAAQLTHDLGGMWSGVRGKVKCPYHDDHDPSLDITVGHTREVIAYCQVCGPVFDRLVADKKVPSGIANYKRKPMISVEQDAYHRLRDALAILKRATLSGKHPIAYYRGRGLDSPPGAMLLPADDAARLLSLQRRKRLLPPAPAAVLPIINGERLQGVTCTLLTKAADANRKDDKGRSMRRFHGAMKGGFVKVTEGAIDPDKPMVTGEGVETSAAAALLSGYQGCAFLSTSNATSVSLPPCSELIIARDRGKPGQNAAKALVGRYARLLPVRVAVPPKGYKDFNDALQAAQRGDLDRKQLRRQIVSAPLSQYEDDDVAPLTAGDFMMMQFPRREALLNPWLATSGLVQIHANRGDGKTMLGLGCANGVGTGDGLLGWTCNRAARCLYVDGELPGSMLQKRIALLGPPCPNLMVLSNSAFRLNGKPMPRIDDPEGQAYYDKIIERNGLEVLFFDSLSTLASAEIEKDASAWMPLQQWFLQHCAHGRTIIYFHHDSRSGRARGHSKKEDQLDASIQIKLLERPSHHETVMELIFDKHRDFYGRDAEPMIVRLSTKSGFMEWTYQSKREDTRERIAELLEDGYSQSEIATELNLSKGRISQIVKELRLREARKSQRV